MTKCTGPPSLQAGELQHTTLRNIDSGLICVFLVRMQAVNHVHIPFAKHTMWKKAIIKGTLDTCREVHEDMVLCLLKLLACMMLSYPTSCSLHLGAEVT